VFFSSLYNRWSPDGKSDADFIFPPFGQHGDNDSVLAGLDHSAKRLLVGVFEDADKAKAKVNKRKARAYYIYIYIYIYIYASVCCSSVFLSSQSALKLCKR